MKSGRFDGYFAIGGIVLFGIGVAIMKIPLDLRGLLRVLPYICIGFGCSIFGYAVGNILSRKLVKKYPESQKKIAIDKKDERNIAIANRAKAKAYDITVFIFSGLIFSFALWNNMKLSTVVMFVCAYFFIIGCYIYYLLKYNKEM